MLELMNDTKKIPTVGRKLQKNENDLIDEEYQIKPEALNTRALAIINRVNNKLTGNDLIHSVFLTNL